MTEPTDRTTEPRVHAVSVPCDAKAAFELFTTRAGEWWPPEYTPDPDTFDTVVVEPRPGGRVLMRMRDGAEHDFGVVTVWEPGEVYAQTWTLAQDPAHPSSLTVTFSDRSHGCLVVLEHGGWNADNAGDRARFGDWALILQRYVDRAREQR